MGEEQRLANIRELFTFRREPGENVDALLARFLQARFRAQQNGGGMTMSWKRILMVNRPSVQRESQSVGTAANAVQRTLSQHRSRVQCLAIGYQTIGSRAREHARQHRHVHTREPLRRDG